MEETLQKSPLDRFMEQESMLKKRPHSIIRGLSAFAGWVGGIYGADQAGFYQLNEAVPELPYFIIGTGILAGGATFLTHGPTEEINRVMRKVYPEEKTENTIKTTAEYIGTGAIVTAGLAGVASYVMGVPETEQQQVVAAINHVAGQFIPALYTLAEAAGNFFLRDQGHELWRADQRFSSQGPKLN